MTRGQQGRAGARLVFASAVAAVVVASLVFVPPPALFGPMFHDATIDAVMIIAGLVGAAIGLAWMLRILRTDPEPDQRTPRYRDRD